VHTRVLQSQAGTLVVRPLRRGDVRTVLAVFERLGETSRRLRFNGAKPCLHAHELRRLAAVDARHHALVAYLENDARPVAIARLVRTGSSAEVAFEVVDEYQQQGIGSALIAELVADARAAGIAEITALVASDNRAALTALKRALGELTTRIEGPDRWISAAIATGTA
jgi:ribosomal protein S18 acetylase RimI-like enzyme